MIDLRPLLGPLAPRHPRPYPDPPRRLEPGEKIVKSVVDGRWVIVTPAPR